MEIIINTHLTALPETNELKVTEERIVKLLKLEPITMKLLKYLLDNRGKLCTNQKLIDNIWQGNQEVGKPALRKNIYKLRSILTHLEENDLVQTIPKKGYRLKALNSFAKNQSSKRLKLFYYIIGIIILLIIIKIVFPGIIHRLLH